MRKPIKVEVWSSDSWSGQELEYIEFFDDIESAEKFTDSINFKNKEKRVPDFYIFAKQPEANLSCVEL